LISRLFAEPQYDNLVDIHSVNPTIVVELRYATADNITGRRLCPKEEMRRSAKRGSWSRHNPEVWSSDVGYVIHLFQISGMTIQSRFSTPQGSIYS